jgi:hypothetical protein
MFVDLFTQLHDMIVALDDGIFAQFIACLVQIKNPNLLGRELTSIQNFHIEGAESILLCLVDEFIDEDDDGFDEFLEAEDLTPSEATQTDATIIEDGLAVVVTEGVE